MLLILAENPAEMKDIRRAMLSARKQRHSFRQPAARGKSQPFPERI